MLKFITNLFGIKQAEPAAPYKIEAPVLPVAEAPVVNPVKPVVNGRKQPAKKPVDPVATGNKPTRKPQPKKTVSPGANKTTKPKK